MRSIDLNCDTGEMPEAIADGSQEALMGYVSSVNIACGAHAGDEFTMRTTVEQALRRSVAIGAHTGYADRVHFGRMELALPSEAIADTVFEQVTKLGEIVSKCGARISHVKAHGALYDQGAREMRIAAAFAAGIARWNRGVVLLGLAGSPMLHVFRSAGFAVAAEAFADRRYEPDGSLRSRKFADALIADAADAAEQALRIAEKSSVIAYNRREIEVEAQTICIHGDTPGALTIAAAVKQRLSKAGIAIRPLGEASSKLEN